MPQEGGIADTPLFVDFPIRRAKKSYGVTPKGESAAPKAQHAAQGKEAEHQHESILYTCAKPSLGALLRSPDLYGVRGT